MRLENNIRSPRLLIRSYEKSDLGFVTSMWLDPENGRYLSDPTADRVDAVFQKALDTLQDSPHGWYLIIELAGERVGSFSVFPEGDIYDIGYCIHKDHWRRGYAAEALTVMLDWMRAQGAKAVTAEVAAENTASNALLQKFGFTVERQTSFKKYNMDMEFESFIYAKEL